MNEYIYQDSNVLNHIISVVEIMNISHLNPNIQTPYKVIVKILIYGFELDPSFLSEILKLYSQQIGDYCINFLKCTNYEYDVSVLQLDAITIHDNLMTVEFLFRRSTQ